MPQHSLLPVSVVTEILCFISPLQLGRTLRLAMIIPNSKFLSILSCLLDSVNLPSEIKCENPPMTAECSAFRCMYSTIYLTPFQCRALPRPVPRRESRETALAVSIQKGLSVSLRQELPGHSVSSVLSLDSVPAPFYNPAIWCCIVNLFFTDTGIS